jgi:hypothetical protein
MLELNANDYVQIYWQADDGNMRLVAQGTQTLVGPPEYTIPAIPSVIVTVQQVMYTQVGPTGVTGHGPTGMTGITGTTGHTGPPGPSSTQFQYVTISGLVLDASSVPVNTGKTLTISGLEIGARYAINWFLNEGATNGGSLNDSSGYLTASGVDNATSFVACNVDFPTSFSVYDYGGNHRISGSVVDTIITTATSVTFTLWQNTDLSFTTNGKLSMQITKAS